MRGCLSCEDQMSLIHIYDIPFQNLRNYFIGTKKEAFVCETECRYFVIITCGTPKYWVLHHNITLLSAQ